MQGHGVHLKHESAATWLLTSCILSITLMVSSTTQSTQPSPHRISCFVYGRQLIESLSWVVKHGEVPQAELSTIDRKLFASYTTFWVIRRHLSRWAKVISLGLRTNDKGRASVVLLIVVTIWASVVVVLLVIIVGHVLLKLDHWVTRGWAFHYLVDVNSYIALVVFGHPSKRVIVVLISILCVLFVEDLTV